MVDFTAWQYRQVLRYDLATFMHRCYQELYPQDPLQWNWHLEVMAAALQDCLTGKTTRLIVTVPPRYLKSILASVALPAFWLGHNPAAAIMCVSYGQDLSDKHALDCRKIIQSPAYRAVFPNTRLADKQSIQEFSTTKNGFRLATSIGGVVTGRGADVIIIDDPLKPDDALSDVRRIGVNSFYNNSLYSRLNSKKDGRIILIQQRLHGGDLVSHVMEQEGWKVVSLPAIAQEDETHSIRTVFGPATFKRSIDEALHPQRESLEVLLRLKGAMTEYNFYSQYLQQPQPLDGTMIKHVWFVYYEPHELPSSFDTKIISFDTANKAGELNDYTVATVWGVKDNHFYLLDVVRGKMEFYALQQTAISLQARHNANTILIEDKASGTQLIQELRRAGYHQVVAYMPPANTDKIMRVYNQASSFIGGFVHLPKSASFLPEYVRELTSFPGGKYDDQVDSTMQALDWFKSNPPNIYLEWMKAMTR